MAVHRQIYAFNFTPMMVLLYQVEKALELIQNSVNKNLCFFIDVNQNTEL